MSFAAAAKSYAQIDARGANLIALGATKSISPAVLAAQIAAASSNNVILSSASMLSVGTDILNASMTAGAVASGALCQDMGERLQYLVGGYHTATLRLVRVISGVAGAEGVSASPVWVSVWSDGTLANMAPTVARSG